MTHIEQAKDLVPTLENCKAMYERGYRGETYFVFCHGDLIPKNDIVVSSKESEILPAPTASELILLLTKASETGDFHLERNADDGTYGVLIDCFKDDDYIYSDTPENALCLMAITLHDKGLIDLSKLS